jgi:HAD superfamily hydrolase (TIGR01459 family)
LTVRVFSCDGSAMTDLPRILSGLSEIADAYDALICDVWGVVHDGHSPRRAAVDALHRFRKTRGPVVLLSNAPRPVSDIEKQFARLGVALDCYDAIITSGTAAREDIARRAQGNTPLPILHIGPERDRGIFEGLAIGFVTKPDTAAAVVCTGLYDDDNESPADYRNLLEAIRKRQLTFLCANPDIVVQRGGRLVYCAGALAQTYEMIGGSCIYYGKPFAPVYEAALAALKRSARRDIAHPLAVGDGIVTDIAGANAMGIDAVFIADGIHGAEIPELARGPMKEFFDAHRVVARAAMRGLVW